MGGAHQGRRGACPPFSLSLAVFFFFFDPFPFDPWLRGRVRVRACAFAVHRALRAASLYLSPPLCPP